ncbi:MAG: TetR/AcrR family transcriptional regulator [Bacillota bacterium]|nr:TetR/AcrR family transcriptional regulator [Bacillota bacterium]
MSPRTDEQNQAILDKRREEILNAALSEFARKGYSGTKISGIAKAGSISQGLIYHYYSSKDELYAAVIERAIESSESIVNMINQYNLKGWQGLSAITEGVINYIKAGKEELLNFFFIYQAIMLDPMPKCVKDALAKEMKILPTTAQLMKEAQEEGTVIQGDPFLLASTFWSTLQGIIMTKVTVMYMDAPQGELVPDSNLILRMFKQ